MRSNPIRFTGLASGMDTDSIVKDMLRPQQYKIDKEKKAQALVKLKQDAWKDMNKKMFDFHTKFTHKLSLKSTYDKNITTSSNSNAIEMDNESRVPAGTHKFEVTQLATATSVTGRKITAKADTKISELMEGEQGKNGIAIKLKVNGVEHTVITKGEDTLDQVAQRINKELKGTGFTARYDAANGRFFANSNKTGRETITFDSVHEITKPAIEAKPADGEIPAVEFEKAEFKPEAMVGGLGKLGLNVAADFGQGSIYKYNGVEIKGNSNQIEVNGIKATLKAVTTATEPVIISSVPDPDATYDFIKEFVTEYNNLIEELNLKVGTKPGKDIEPLTAEERDSMSDTEIKLWEEKLNSSLFYKDPEIASFLDSARSILSSQFGGDLAALGIVTGSWEEKGKLHIIGDEDDDIYSGKPNKLKEALAKDPQAVADKFYEVGQALYTNHNTNLIRSSKLKSAMNFYNDKVIGDKIKTSEKRIMTLEERMYNMEKMQYAKFATMEKMLSRLNSQGSWLAQQFGGN